MHIRVRVYECCQQIVHGSSAEVVDLINVGTVLNRDRNEFPRSFPEPASLAERQSTDNLNGFGPPQLSAYRPNSNY